MEGRNMKSKQWIYHLIECIMIMAFTGLAVFFGVMCIYKKSVMIAFIGGLFIVAAGVVAFMLLRDFLYEDMVMEYWRTDSGFSRAEVMTVKDTAENMVSSIAGFSDMIYQEKNNYSEKILEKKAEISVLQSQINPHFLYNTLDAIRGLAIVRKVPEIEEMTGALSKLFRYSISISGNLQTFQEEINNLENYIIIQKYRFNDRFEVIKEFEDWDEIKNIEIPKLLLQPLVENAIYHGIEQIIHKGEIRISAYLTDQTFVIQVSDNGFGMDVKSLEILNKSLNEEEHLASSKGSGIALKNVNQRIKLNYGEEYGLVVYSTKGLGTIARITLPH